MYTYTYIMWLGGWWVRNQSEWSSWNNAAAAAVTLRMRYWDALHLAYQQLNNWEFWPQICVYSCLSSLPGIRHPMQVPNSVCCQHENDVIFGLWCMHIAVATKCVRLCTCIIGIKVRYAQACTQPMGEVKSLLFIFLLPGRSSRGISPRSGPQKLDYSSSSSRA